MTNILKSSLCHQIHRLCLIVQFVGCKHLWQSWQPSSLSTIWYLSTMGLMTKTLRSTLHHEVRWLCPFSSTYQRHEIPIFKVHCHDNWFVVTKLLRSSLCHQVLRRCLFSPTYSSLCAKEQRPCQASTKISRREDVVAWGRRRTRSRSRGEAPA